MSINFHLDAQLAIHTRPCTCVANAAERLPGNATCGYCRNGSCREATYGGEPPVNFSNVNATAILRLFGLPPEPYGSVALDQIPRLLGRVEMLLAAEELREPATRAERLFGQRWLVGAQTDALVVRSLQEIRHLLLAVDRRCGLLWG